MQLRMLDRTSSRGWFHKLILSKLRRSILRGLFTMLSLYTRSSPPAVRPPIYHFSAPIDVSRNPSVELSDPLRPLLCSGVSVFVPGEPGDREYEDVVCCLLGWNWPADRATVVAPVDAWPVFVVIAFACVAIFAVCEAFALELEVPVLCTYEVCVVVPVVVFCKALCALKADRKLPKNGLFVVGILDIRTSQFAS